MNAAKMAPICAGPPPVHGLGNTALPVCTRAREKPPLPRGGMMFCKGGDTPKPKQVRAENMARKEAVNSDTGLSKLTINQCFSLTS